MFNILPMYPGLAPVVSLLFSRSVIIHNEQYHVLICTEHDYAVQSLNHYLGDCTSLRGLVI